MFGITGDFAGSEELNVLSVGAGNAALLAISALMQGNLAEAGLSERLANFASDIEQDGTWDDAVTKAQMADWASTASLSAIRSHIEGWNTGNQAPAFESAFRAFWWNLYGLGTCAASNDGEIKQDTNSLSANHGVRYICDAGDWRKATVREYGTMTYGGQTYKTIGIGTQMWMAENLNYDYKVNGSTYGNWCYNNSADSCAKYGRLYTWGAAMDSATTGCGFGTTCAASSGKVRGICPTGWHLPSAAEWSTLITAVGDSAGTKLKSTSGWYSNGNGTDAYGFSALSSGGRYSGGSFDDTGYSADFWSASEDYRDCANLMGDCANLMELYYSYAGASQRNDYKSNSFAVRCVKD